MAAIVDFSNFCFIEYVDTMLHSSAILRDRLSLYLSGNVAAQFISLESRSHEITFCWRPLNLVVHQPHQMLRLEKGARVLAISKKTRHFCTWQFSIALMSLNFFSTNFLMHVNVLEHIY